MTIALVIANSLTLAAQESPQNAHRKACYHAFVSGKMDNWVPIISKLEHSTLATLQDKFELLRYYYGYSAYLIGIKENKKAKIYVNKGDKLINSILKEEPKNATALAFKGSFTGFKIVLNKLKIITLGPESMRYINRAYKTDPNNIQAIIDKANLLYFTPKLFGGNKKEAFAFFERSIAKIESQYSLKDNWYYLALLSLLSENYAKAGFHDKASAIQQKIQRIEPNMKWIQEKILSKLEVDP